MAVRAAEPLRDGGNLWPGLSPKGAAHAAAGDGREGQMGGFGGKVNCCVICAAFCAAMCTYAANGQGRPP